MDTTVALKFMDYSNSVTLREILRRQSSQRSNPDSIQMVL